MPHHRRSCLWTCDYVKGYTMSNKSPRSALPGEMYQKNGRWWWKVRLPGEPRVRERALRPDGAQYAAKTRRAAEKAAGEMWRRAIEADTEARIRAELKEQTEQKIAAAKAKAAEAIANIKSEFSEKIRACEKALAEAERKAKIEASLRTDAEQAAQSHAEGLEKVAERTRRETKLRIEAEQKAKMESHARSIAEARLEAETELRAEAEHRAASRVEGVPAFAGMTLPSNRDQDARNTVTPAPVGGLKRHSPGDTSLCMRPPDTENNGRTASCEGCGRDNVPENDLSRIESGQLVCPECMMVART